MTTIVFAGTARDAYGAQISRPECEAIARYSGYEPQYNCTKDTGIVVTSFPANTVRAKKAKEYGVRLVSYGTFLEKLLDGEKL